MPDTTDVLCLARSILAKHGQWTKGAWVKRGDRIWDEDQDWDDLGETYEVRPNDVPACRVCAEGAVYVAAHHLGHDQRVAETAIRELETVTPGECVVDYNDAESRRKRDVLALFDKAIGDDRP